MLRKKIRRFPLGDQAKALMLHAAEDPQPASTRRADPSGFTEIKAPVASTNAIRPFLGRPLSDEGFAPDSLAKPNTPIAIADNPTSTPNHHR